MGYLALTLDVRFVEQVFEMLKPHLHELKVKLKSREHIVFPPIIKYSFCKFVTSAIAEQFKELGVLIYDFGECPSQGNPYHAAASNNAAFLDYLWRNLDIPPYAPNRHGDSPLTIAQRGHNAEAIRWFRLKRLLQVATLRQIKPAPRIYIAI
ncbi:hypothetical protein N7468_007517 [Penicillium chermesinum]|uniref:Uncharacterized protein n=1 Tax=Penicillium chermesinum TaxID=63820 RepID=A0A9W9TKJ8_9EURO|nr:uncharacterized protein N7468_007517 [Penicillium chermesinum]KAJ5226292.1 hypothetical protein N7468_007517 [Penicillium chermesinum]